MKKILLALTFLVTICYIAVAQQVATDADFTESFSYGISLLTVGVTFAIKSNLLKDDGDATITKLMKNSWVISFLAFGAIALVFVKFGLTAANATLAFKFIAANFLGVIIGLFTNKPTTSTLPETPPISSTEEQE